MAAPKRLNDVPGWRSLTDQLLFEWVLSWQTRTQEPGDLVEVGVYKGKSAIHIGRFLQKDERLTVCDLFDDAGTEQSIRADARKTYQTLSQSEFESNYLAFHDELPTIVRGLSSVITDHVEAGSCRLVHIDASHMYEHVREDTASARQLLRGNGVVVFDDYRTEHTVGTAAAVWEAITNDGLNPIACSSMKMYATWGDPAAVRDEIIARVAERVDHKVDVSQIQRGSQIVRVAAVKKPSAPAKPAANLGLSDALERSKRAEKIAEAALVKADEAIVRVTTPWTVKRVKDGVVRRVKT